MADTRPSSGSYAGGQVALATMHGKERAFRTPLRRLLGLDLRIPHGIDTDRLGTFTGDIPRRGTMLEAAVAKARLGMALTGLKVGIASEGAYGAHPTLPFLPGGTEVAVFVDDERGIVVSEHLIEDAPVFHSQTARDLADLRPFLTRARFPSHALVVRSNDGAGPIMKGIASREALADALRQAAAGSADGLALVQNDMRAHRNPTRMRTIRRLAQKLAERLASTCPACGAGGFGLVEVELGLPCEECGVASALPCRHVHACPACDHAERRPVPGGQPAAPALYCEVCNP